MEFEKLNKKVWSEKYIRKHFPDDYTVINEFPGNTFSEKIYNALHNNTRIAKCPVCGKQLSFINVTKGYRKVCSQECNYKIRYEKTKQTCLKRYGVENYSATKECREKVKQTCLKRYNGIGTASEKTKQKGIDTCLKRYGVENYSATKECREKVKQTCLKRYGVENYSATNEYKNRIKQTCLEKYGTTSVFASNIVKNKSKQTCLEKYGTTNGGWSEIAQRKIKETNNVKYGCDFAISSAEIRNKINNTFRHKYNVENPLQIENIKQKVKETKDKNHTHNTSSIEEQFASWLDENNILYIRQYKSEQYPFCCDFYFPEKDLYFEINGHWSHGLHPFDENNEDDKRKVGTWKQKGTEYYNNAIKTWTVSDTLKVNTANENKLNFRVVYSCKLDEVIKEYKR